METLTPELSIICVIGSSVLSRHLVMLVLFLNKPVGMNKLNSKMKYFYSIVFIYSYFYY